MNGGLDILQLISSKPILYFLILTFIITNIFVLVLLGGLNYYLIHIGNRYVESTKKIELRKKYIKYFFHKIKKLRPKGTEFISAVPP